MSQLDSESTTIGEFKFEVFKLDPFTAQDVLIDIGQVLAPALGRAATMFGEMGESALDLDVEDPRVASAVASLAQGITKERMRSLCNTLAGVSHCNGKPLSKVFDAVFRGDLPLMYQWLWFALRVNFGNFTGWAGSAIGGVSKQKTPSPSRNTSVGTGQ